MTLYYEVRYGSDKGMRLTPHRYRDKRFRMRRETGDPWIVVEEDDASHGADGSIGEDETEKLG